MIIRHTIEKQTKAGLQVLEITANANSQEEANELGYDDFNVNLYIDKKFIADISPVLSKTCLYTDMIDSVEWGMVYSETKADLEIEAE